MSDEVRIADPVTGGQKGQKLARFDLLPAKPLRHIAEVYGKGAEKYEDRNWERGYRYGLSFGAMQRHAWAFWNGESEDPESGLPHLAHVAWHALTLMEFVERGIGTDDRSRFVRPVLTPKEKADRFQELADERERLMQAETK